MTFFESSFLWLEAVIASSVMATACAVVGVYAIVKRVVFLPASLSQIASLGVVVSFLLTAGVSDHAHPHFNFPLLISFVFTIGISVLLGLLKEPKRVSKEAIIGVAFIVASALVIIIGNKIPQESHHVEDILFGNAVVVEKSQMYIAIFASIIVLLLNIFLFNGFMFVSYDADTARVHGMPVTTLNIVLFTSMGIAISVATKTFGALPTFAYAVLPALAALKLFTNMKYILLSAAILGLLSAFFGYWASFTFDLPTGACCVVIASLIFAISFLISLFLK